VARAIAVWTLLVCLAAARAAAQEPPLRISVAARSYRPGELLVVTVASGTSVSAVRVRAFGGEAVAFPSGGAWTALVGIDLAQKVGRYQITAEADGLRGPLTASHRIDVVARSFRTRRLTVAPDYVNPSGPILERIEKDQAFLRAVFADPSRERLWRSPFVRPVPGEANSSFGTRSVYNGEARSPHAGTDFLSPSGTPIRAPSSGRVVCARDLFFTGNTVVIDHGLGLFSMLAHLSRLDVKEGDAIDSGTVVGLVGATGRVTGAHLHWSLTMSGARVDPLSALAVLQEGEAQTRPSAR
jgi:murein DD-endopeptidase MepM/ murein hydrolase activator NlpD